MQEQQRPPQLRRLNAWHAAIAIALLSLAPASASLKHDYDGLLHVHVMDIGQGDSIFIVTPSGRQILLDGGPDSAVLSRLGQYVPPWDHDLDMAIVSHPHSDHISGLVSVLGHFHVAHILEAGEFFDSPQFTAWQRAVADSQSEHLEAVAGQVIDMGDGVILRILAPLQSVAGTSTKKPHDDMVVVMLEYGQVKMLLTGDMEEKLEKQLIADGNMDIDILKVGHHGSKTSTSDELLAASTPQVGIISVGAHNMYHLPSPIILGRLADYGIPYYRTDQSGDVSVVSDGHTFSVSTQR